MKDISAFKIRASCLLCRHDLIRFLNQGRDKAQRNGHHHGQLVNRHPEPFQRPQQRLQSVRQPNGAGGVGHQKRTHDQKHNADNHEKRILDALFRNAKDAPFQKIRFSRCEENIQDTGKGDNDHQRLQPAHQRLEADLGYFHAHGQRGRHNHVSKQALGAEQRNDVQRDQ